MRTVTIPLEEFDQLRKEIELLKTDLLNRERQLIFVYDLDFKELYKLWEKKYYGSSNLRSDGQ